MKKNYPVFLVIWFSFISLISFSQVNQGGSPLSFQNPQLLKSELVFETMPGIDIKRLLAEDSINDHFKDIPWRFGENLYVNYNLTNSGSWDILPQGDKVWRLGIKSPGAYTINLTFDNYHIPPGAKLYVYNTQKTKVIGAFTDFNNQDDKVFATTLVPGDEIVIEYYEPADPEFPGELNLYRVTHGYRDAFKYAKSFGGSGSCNNNVACPEAAAWQNEVRSVCMLVSGGSGFCSGSVVNNTDQNGIPYVLTANHCYSDPSSWVFWFNWQSPTCDNPPANPPYDAMSGASLKARYLDSDFCLVQINTTPPASYNVYYAGWNRENVAATSGAGIHHPSADIKKISYVSTPFVSATWSGTPPDSHWQTFWSDGVTEPGSSGSPIFDQNHHVVGQLHGGPSACGVTDLWDFYGKFSMSWDHGTTSATRLKDWLDPTNTSVLTLDGYDPNAGLNAIFAATNTIICTDSSVTFTNSSTGSPTSWNWSFPGGTPTSFSGQTPPSITYSAAGAYDVSLTVSDGTNTDTETKTGYITVKNVIANFTGTPTTVVIGNTVTFTDNSSCNPATWNWSFPGGTPSSYDGQNPPAITYTTLGTYDVTLTVTKPGDTDTKTRTGYIIVTPPIFNMTDGTITTCTGDFYDSGGSAGSYQNNENHTETFYPSTPGSMIRFTFTSFSTESGYDYLRIYNGTSTAAPLIGTYNGTTGPGTVTASNGSGALTFNFTSDGSVTSTGWAASISCQSTTLPPVADFIASSVNPPINSTVTFTDLSSNLPTSWSWSFTPGSVVYMSGTNANSQNPQVQFTTIGPYTVSLTASNPNGSDNETKTNYINTVNCSPCASTSSNATEEWISNVTFNTINNTSAGGAGYQDFTSISTNVNPGSAYDLSVSCGSTGSWTEHYWAFFDWNHDCDFTDPGESYDLGQAVGAGTMTLNITVPSGALPGPTRMRVSLKYNSDPTSCETLSYGQVEDYTVNVQSTTKNLNLKAYLEGLYNGAGTMRQAYDATGPHFGTGIADQVTVELHNATNYSIIEFTSALVSISTIGEISINTIPAGYNGSYYITIRHRNSIETTSALPVSFTGNTITYDFTTAASQAFGNNTKPMGTVFAIYGGDGTQDGFVDGSDLAAIDNASTAVLVGYIPEDINGDGIVDGSDMALVDNNSTDLVHAQTP